MTYVDQSTIELIKSKQSAIVSRFGVQPTIDVLQEIEKRVTFLINKLVEAKAKGFVLGISGGLDSFNAGMLAQIAVNRLNSMTKTNEYKFVAMHLPYGTQKDEEDVQAAIDVIKPTEFITYNIKPAVDAGIKEMKKSGVEISDFIKGNRKARERMLAQYDVAATNQLLVIGTDHAAEAITGFYTKYGDGACDLTPLSTLNKRQGYQLAAHFEAPKNILTKKPTADLEDDKPLLSDEDSLGVTYDQIDDFLIGNMIEVQVALKLIEQYEKTEHKRSPIPGI